jgi:hypothetical protein
MKKQDQASKQLLMDLHIFEDPKRRVKTGFKNYFNSDDEPMRIPDKAFQSVPHLVRWLINYNLMEGLQVGYKMGKQS